MTVALIILLLVAVVTAALVVMRSRAQLPPPEESPALPPAKEPAKTEATPAKTEAPPTPSATPAKTEAPAPAPAPAKTEADATQAPAVVGPAPAKTEAPAPAPAPVEAKPAPAPEPERPKRDLSALRKGLAQTRTGWMDRLLSVFGGKKELDPALIESIEETLLTGDVGTKTSRRFIEGLKERLDRREASDPDRVWEALKEDTRSILDVPAPPFGAAARGTKPFVLLMVGVNGAGKTTTIAKLAARYKEAGKSVLLAAGDTFRAAAVTQLEMWGRRVGVPVHKGKDGAKPSAVVYEAVAQAVGEGTDVVIADTAGRLQTKAPLMEELRKIRDACGKACPGAPHEVLLVLDATTGQNALSQAREFRETLDLTGIVLTKLDGTAKGGVILAIADEFKLPVRFIGVGEKSDDLREFDAGDFVDALFTRAGDEAAA